MRGLALAGAVSIAAMSIVAVAAAAGCERAEVRSVLHYDFASLGVPESGTHYQQFASIDGYVVDLGCYTVELRQTNCFDTAGTGEPNLHLAVVECDCPCTLKELDPCDESRPMVTTGVVRGIVTESDGAYVFGGVEIPSRVDLGEAADLFFTIEPDDDPDPGPSGDVLLSGELEPDGSSILRGRLDAPGLRPERAEVTVVLVEDEVHL